MTQSEDIIHRMFRAALKAVDPAAAVANSIRCQGRELAVGGRHYEAPGKVIVVGVGKAAASMARGLDLTCGCTIDEGLLLTKDGHASGAPGRFQVREAAHPIPDGRGVAGTLEILELIRGCSEGDVIVALISGGGSALLEAPRPPATLADLAAATNLLLRAGAPIHDLNAVRIPLSQVKGGGLREAAPDATFISLLLSDVLGNDPRTIASGPTVPTNLSAVDALTIIERYHLTSKVPQSVVRVLADLDSHPKEDVVAGADDVVLIVADNAKAVEAARRDAESAGLHAKIEWTDMTGEASELGRKWVQACQAADDEADVLIGGGEATVTVHGSGVGGRNTEFALAACQELERLNVDDWVIASLATDGQDGTSDLTGAIVSPEIWNRAKVAGIDPEVALANNDSATVFNLAGGAVKTGPTGTNVNDLFFAVRRRS